MRTRRETLTFLTSSVLATGAALGAGVARAKDSASHGDGADAFEALMTRMLEAVKAGSYDQFVADGDDKLKSLAKAMFATASGRFAPMLKKGYRTTFLAKLRKDDHELLLWKLALPAGKEDFEVRMAVANGRVDGFWLV